MPIQSDTFNSAGTKLGAYKLGDAVLDKLSDFQPFVPNDSSAAPPDYRHVGDRYYRGTGTVNAPEIGDVRVSFGTFEAQPISVVAEVLGDTLDAFHSKHDYIIAIAKPGAQSANELIKAQKREERKFSWIWRGVGCVAMAFGFFLAGKPVSTVLDVLPFMEGIADAGRFLLALTLAVPLALLTIAVAWIAHRPALGVGLLVAAGVLFWLLSSMRSKPQIHAGIKW
jgi:hypothetical protein